MAKDMKQKYIGSTSSVSAVLSHFYFVMSNFKLLNTSCLSRAFDKEVNVQHKHILLERKIEAFLFTKYSCSQQSSPVEHAQQRLFT